MRLLKKILRIFSGTALLFSGIISIGTSAVLVLLSSLGYLSYSDRPGPGWKTNPHWPSLGELGVYFGFAPWFGYFCLIFGVGIFVLSLAIGFASAPRWVYRLIGALVATPSAGIAVMGAGWYIALAPVGADIAAILGLLYGLFLFPHFIYPRARRLPLLLRIGAGACPTALFLYWITAPFLPHKPVPEIRYELVRLTNGDKPVESPADEAEAVSRELLGLNLRGETHSGIGGNVSGSGEGALPVDLLLIALEPIRSTARLRIPTTGHAVYVLKNGVWTAHPFFSEKDRRSVIIEPGVDTKFDGGRIRIDTQSSPNSFTWYPVIPKGQ